MTFETYQKKLHKTTKPADIRQTADVLSKLNLKRKMPPMFKPIRNPNEVVPPHYNAFYYCADATLEREPNDIISILHRRFKSATNCLNVDGKYCLQLLRDIVEICPLYYFAIENENIMKVRWEGMQFDGLVSDIENKAIEEMNYWYETNDKEKYALKLFILTYKQNLIELTRKEFNLLYSYDRVFYGIKNTYQFEDIKKLCTEIIECIIEMEMHDNNYPFNSSTLASWIIVNKNLKSPCFKILALALALSDKDFAIVKKARENLNEIKKEEVENQWVEVINEDTTELSEIVSVPNYMDHLNLSADEEEQKAFDALYLASQKKK